MAVIKKHQRLLPVVTNAFFSLAPSIGNQLFSIAVTRLFLPEWWGIIVELQLVQYLVTGICSWGNKEYLIREFSLFPQFTISLWNVSFITRLLVLLLPATIILFFFFPTTICLHLATWIICRFVAQSFEAAINFEKKFTSALIVEILSAFVVSAGILLFFHSITFELILVLITVANMTRTAAFVFLFPAWIKLEFRTSLKIDHLKASLPFMLLALTGLIQTKADLAVIDLLLDKRELARYQIFTNFLVLIRTASSFLVYPFLKNLYRLPREKIVTLATKLLLLGIPLCLTGLGVLFIFMHYVYRLSGQFNWYALGFFYCLPGFWFSPIIFYLFKLRMEKKVTLINLLGIAISIGLCLLLIKPLGISGALIASTSAQLAMWVCYVLLFGKINKESVC